VDEVWEVEGELARLDGDVLVGKHGEVDGWGGTCQDV